jgi:hypothetical protein
MVTPIPGYREGTPEEHCGNCGSFSKVARRTNNSGLCHMFYRIVRENKTCAKWWERGGVKPDA